MQLTRRGYIRNSLIHNWLSKCSATMRVFRQKFDASFIQSKGVAKVAACLLYCVSARQTFISYDADRRDSVPSPNKVHFNIFS